MQIIRLLVISLFFLTVVSGCGNKSGNSALTGSKIDSLLNNSPSDQELTMPVIPSEMTSKEEKIEFIISRFWDEMDFRDTLRSHSDAFLEQNFVNFITFFPQASNEVIKKGVNKLLSRASTDTIAYRKIVTIADLYLFRPDSPYYSEEFYFPFLEQAVKSGMLEAEHLERVEWELEVATKNRKGEKATDFVFQTPDGKTLSLLKYKSKGDLLLILFYDPDCDNCKNYVKQISENKAVRKLIEENKLDIMAIDPGYNENLWKSSAEIMPDNWIVGYNETIEENDLYIFRALPSLYLLDRNKKILLKDGELKNLFPLLETFIKEEENKPESK